MRNVFALANQKGGVGKTTATINLAFALTQSGKQVLVVDADPQASLTLYCGKDPRSLELQKKTLYWGLQADDTDILSFIIPGPPDLLPSSIYLAKAEQEFANEWDSVSIFKQKIQPLRERYDFILIDCPPTLTLLTVNALVAVDAVIIPVKTDYLSIMGIPLLIETIQQIRRRQNPHLSIVGVLPTMYTSRNNHDNEALTEIRNSLAKTLHVFEPIHRSTWFDKAAAEGRSTLELHPDTPSVKNYYQLAEYLVAYGKEI